MGIAFLFVTRVSPARFDAPPLFTTPPPVAIEDSAFAQTVAAYSERDAAVFVEQGIRWTWAELDREVAALAHGFRDEDGSDRIA